MNTRARHASRADLDSVTTVVSRFPSQQAAATRVCNWSFTWAASHNSSNNSFIASGSYTNRLGFL
jgi:hypothetical protein